MPSIQKMEAGRRNGKKAWSKTPKRTVCKYGHPLSGDNLTTGKRQRCKQCRTAISKSWAKKNKNKCAATTARWRDNNKEKSVAIQRRSVLKRYGTTPEQVEKTLREQNGCCANLGCLTDMPGGRVNQWRVDHDHATGKFRGLLCNNCNIALGLLKDDTNRILGLVEYLRNKGD